MQTIYSMRNPGWPSKPVPKQAQRDFREIFALFAGDLQTLSGRVETEKLLLVLLISGVMDSV